MDATLKGCRAFLHFQVFVSDTHSTTTTPMEAKEQRNDKKQLITSEAISKGYHLNIISSTWKLISSSQICECIRSMMKLSRVAPSLDDITYSSLSVTDMTINSKIPTTTTRTSVPQIGVLLSSVNAISSLTHYGYDRVVITLLNKLIEIGIGKKISYQRILIDWHAQEELDYNLQGPRAAATVLPFGSHQVQYLFTLPPPSPLEEDGDLQPNRLHRDEDSDSLKVSATSTNRWNVPFLHFGERLLLMEHQERLWWRQVQQFTGEQYGERGAYICGAAILTMKSISELIFESLPSTIIMLAPLIVDMLPTWERWNKQTISCRDTLPSVIWWPNILINNDY
jgi:hypothetical protein